MPCLHRGWVLDTMSSFCCATQRLVFSTGMPCPTNTYYLTRSARRKLPLLKSAETCVQQLTAQRGVAQLVFIQLRSGVDCSVSLPLRQLYRIESGTISTNHVPWLLLGLDELWYVLTDQVPVPPTIFPSNSKLEQNLQCSGVNYTLLITMTSRQCNCRYVCQISLRSVLYISN